MDEVDPPPHVSVCVPAYNAEPFIRATLDNVLASDHDDFEVVVLDNASTDATAEIVRSVDDPRVRLEHNTALLALPDNWNRVVELSRGELVKVVSADDLIRPDALRHQAVVLDEQPDVALVASRRHLIDGDGSLIVANTGLRGLIGRLSPAQVTRRVIRHGGNPVGESAAVMFRRADFDACGGFDPHLLFPMDLELWVRLLAHGDFVGLRETGAAFRASALSLSGAQSDLQYAEQRALTRRLEGDRRWEPSAGDRAVGRVGAQRALFRRRLLFWLAAHPRASGLSRRLTVREDVSWLSAPARPAVANAAATPVPPDGRAARP